MVGTRAARARGRAGEEGPGRALRRAPTTTASSTSPAIRASSAASSTSRSTRRGPIPCAATVVARRAVRAHAAAGRCRDRLPAALTPSALKLEASRNHARPGGQPAPRATCAARSTRTCARSRPRSTSRSRAAASGSRCAASPTAPRAPREPLEKFYAGAKRELTVEDIQLGLVEVARAARATAGRRSAGCCRRAAPTCTARTPRQREYLRSIVDARHHVRHRPGRHRQDLPRGRLRGRRARARRGEAHRARAPRGRGGRAARLPARRPRRRRSIRTCGRSTTRSTT